MLHEKNKKKLIKKDKDKRPISITSLNLLCVNSYIQSQSCLLKQFYQLINMQKPFNPRNTQSQSKFVHINGTTKQQEPIRWQWLTQRYKKQQQHQQLQPFIPRMTYSQKKTILSDLSKRQRIASSFKIKDGFSQKQKPRIFTTATNATAKTQKKYLQPFIYLNSNQEQLSIPNINYDAIKDELAKRLVQAQLNGKNIIAVLSAKRMGLRYKLFHTFVQICTCNRPAHSHDLRDLTQQIKRQLKHFSKIEKEMYYFFVNRSPVHTYDEVTRSKASLLLFDNVPKIDLNKKVLLKIVEQAEKIQQIFSACGKMKIRQNYAKLKDEINQDEQYVYDWQRITNVKAYVDKISEDPTENMLDPIPKKKNQLLTWYNQKFREDQVSVKGTDKNPLFQSKSHFPNEIKNKKLLSMARERVQSLQKTNNRHKFIPARIDLMMEQVKRQNIIKQSSEGLQKNTLFEATVSKKDLLQYLDKKNTLLATQNIPYLIEKYGLNRFQIYNLYNLYKSFEKVSLLRHRDKKQMEEVLQKGIDRQTFQVGLKGLDMNPGDELIKNICYFGDFISWEQFIKIISISLRKTPQEKLTAILKGISSFDDGFLTRHQISLMIGNSLQKLFDRQQNQLKEYFTNMAMKQFDEKGTGKVSAQTLKEKVLGDGSKNLTMVSFLILNT